MTSQKFDLAACAEMLWLDKPMEWRVDRLTDLGLGVGIWNWIDHNIQKLEKTNARFTIMNGYLNGRLADKEGADALLQSAKQTVEIRKRLDVQ